MAKRVTFQINDMHCTNCTMILERIEDKLEGVLLAEASYKKGRLMVEYDESVLNEEQIAAEVARMGYTVGGRL